MNKELTEKVTDILCEFYHDDEAETAQEIIALCADEAIEAVEEVIDKYRMAEEYVDLLDYAIKEINGRMK